MIINKSTKKLIWPEYHQWYSINNQINKKTNNKPVLLTLLKTNNKLETIVISKTSVNNVTLLTSNTNKQPLFNVKGTINDINKSFVHLNKKKEIEPQINQTITKYLCEIYLKSKFVSESSLKSQLQNKKINTIPINQFINNDICKQAQQIINNIIKLIGSTNISNLTLIIDVDNQDYDMMLVDRKMLRSDLSIFSYQTLYKLTNTQLFDNKILERLFYINSFRDKLLIGIKFNKNYKDQIRLIDCNRNIWATKHKSINIETVNITNNFKTFEFKLDSLSSLQISEDQNNVISIAYVNKGNKTNVDYLRLKPFILRFPSKMSIDSYDDHLSDLNADLTEIITISNNVCQLDNVTTNVNKLVDIYSDLDDNDKAVSFNLIQILKSFKQCVQKYGSDLLIQYLIFNSKTKIPHLSIQ